MRDQSIRGHVRNLEQQGELVHFTKPVHPHRNVSALAWKTYDGLGKSALFSNIEGFPGWRICGQVIADRRKWSIALGVEPDTLIPTLVERIRSPVAPVEIDPGSAPVKEVVRRGDEIDLTRLPAVWHSERDPGPYIASGMAIIKDPETGIRNMSIHRMQILGPDTTGFLICPRHALRIYQMYQARNEPMPVAMVIGAHPALYYAAGFTSSYGLDELTVAGALLGDPVRMVKCETIDLEVPAEAEIVLEGEVGPTGMTPEGPFGEATGTYAMEGSTEIFRVKTITHRREPMFYSMQCGIPMTDTQSITGTCIETVVTDHLKSVEGGARSARCAPPRHLGADGGGAETPAPGRGPGQDGVDGGAVEPLSSPQARDRGRRGHRRGRFAPGVLVADHAGACRPRRDQDSQHPHLVARQRIGHRAGDEPDVQDRHQDGDRRDHARGCGGAPPFRAGDAVQPGGCRSAGLHRLTPGR